LCQRSGLCIALLTFMIPTQGLYLRRQCATIGQHIGRLKLSCVAGAWLATDRILWHYNLLTGRRLFLVARSGSSYVTPQQQSSWKLPHNATTGGRGTTDLYKRSLVETPQLSKIRYNVLKPKTPQSPPQRCLIAGYDGKSNIHF